jgi:iron complex outermembrane receptor protein
VGPYPFSNGIARNDTATNMLTASVSHQHGDWKGEFKVYDNKGHNDLTNDPDWGTFNSRFKMSGFRWKEAFSPWQGGQIVAGLDQETVSGTVSGPHVGSPVGTPFAFNVPGSAEIPSFKVMSVYAGVNQKIALSNSWMMLPSAGARFYNSNHYESKAAPNAGVSLISDSVTVYANYSRGLLYPGAETYAITRALPMAFAANNGWDRLSPTEVKHSEIGVKWSPGPATHIDLSIFKDEVSDRYVWSGFNAGTFGPPPASGTWSNNFPAYRINGGEVSIRHEISSQWSVFGGLTLLDASISNLPYVPDTAVSAGVNGKVGGFRIAFDAQHQSSMYSMTHDRGTFAPNPVDSFAVANARIAYPMAGLGKRGEIYAAINNLFDADYQYNAGYPMPGRNFRVGLISSF